MAVVTVAPAIPVAGGGFQQYNGYADYYCTGVNDQIIINAAIQYVSGAYLGGTVHLLEGTFNIVAQTMVVAAANKAAIVLTNNITLEGSGSGTILTGNMGTDGYDSAFIGAVGTVGTHLVNANVRNLKITSFSGTNGSIGIFYSYVDNSTIEGVQTQCGLRYHIDFLNAGSYNYIINNIVNGNLVSGSYFGIVGTGTGLTISNNKIIQMRSTSTCKGLAIQLLGGIVSNNYIFDLSTSAAGSTCIGLGAYTYNASLLSGNRIEQCKNTGTATNVKGIDIGTGDPPSYTSVTGNYCYNNGSDAGIANTNGNNFYDGGTDTQAYSNSWQSPVTGEPSSGTWHLIVYASRSATPFVNGTVVAASTWSNAVTMPGVPTGATRARCRAKRVGQTNPDALVFEKASGVTLDTAAGYTGKYEGIFAPAGGTVEGMVDIPLDANLQFKFSPLGGVTANFVYNPVAYSC